MQILYGGVFCMWETFSLYSQTNTTSIFTGNKFTDDDLIDLSKDGSYEPDKGTGNEVNPFLSFFNTNLSKRKKNN